MIKHLIQAIAAICVIIMTAPAWAESEPCAKRDHVVERLETLYEKLPASSRLEAQQDQQTLVEV